MTVSTIPRTVEPPSCDDRPMWDIAMSVYHFPTVQVADKLGLFPYLSRKRATAAEIAEHFSLSARATEALLGVVQSLGLVAQQNGRFANTPVARNYLLPESPYYWGGLIQLFRDIPFTCQALLDVLRNDAAVGYEGEDVFEVHEVDAEKAAVFTAAMHSHSFAAATGVALNGHFSGVTRMLDVGGGSACYPIALANRYPEMQFTIMELPAVCPLAQKYIAEFGLADRIDTVSVNMFEDEWPSGYDAVFFSNVFHDWNLSRCRHLTRKSFEVLPPGGRIYVHEVLLDDAKDAPLAATSFSMNMMFFTEGKQFTAAELEHLLTEAGFVEPVTEQTYSYYSLVSARKP